MQFCPKCKSLAFDDASQCAACGSALTGVTPTGSAPPQTALPSWVPQPPPDESPAPASPATGPGADSAPETASSWTAAIRRPRVLIPAIGAALLLLLVGLKLCLQEGSGEESGPEPPAPGGAVALAVPRREGVGTPPAPSPDKQLETVAPTEAPDAEPTAIQLVEPAAGESPQRMVTSEGKGGPGVTELTMAEPKGKRRPSEITLSVPAAPTTGEIKGWVVDAENDHRVPGVQVAIAGTSRATTTDAEGRFHLAEVPAGRYEVSASAPGYVSATRHGEVPAGRALTLKFAISRTLERGKLRFVLSWGEAPKDLDAHLVFQPDRGKPFEVWWRKRGDPTAPPFLGLDVDNREGYGPETITIDKLQPGTYQFFVHDYTNRKTENNSALARSGGSVRLLQGDKERFRFEADGESVGTHWLIMNILVEEDRPRFVPIDRYETRVEEARAAIVFLMDTTGSMARWIEGLKAKCIDLSERLAGRGMDFRLCLIGFGDVRQREPITVRPFRSAAREFQDDVRRVPRTGGGDAPESSVEAIEKALSLTLPEGYQPFFIHITDAPCHRPGELPRLARELEGRGVTMFVVSQGLLRSWYERLCVCGGKFYAMGGRDFPDILMDIADIIKPAELADVLRTDADKEASRRALEALRRLDADAVAPTMLADILRTATDPDAQQWAAESLQRRGEEAVPLLADVLKTTEDRGVQQRTAKALQHLGKDVVPLLIEILKSDDRARVHAATIQTLLQLGGKPGVASLAAAVREAPQPQGLRIVELLGEVRDESALTALRECLRNPNRLIRQRTISVLVATKDPMVVPALVTALTDAESGLAEMALRGIAGLAMRPFEFDPAAPVEERRTAAAEIQAWWDANEDMLIRLREAKLPTGYERVFQRPLAGWDPYGNPVASRAGSVVDPRTGWPYEIWLKAPRMELVLIPAGEFLMGSPDDERRRSPDEGPVHRVRITRRFYLGKYEVTQAQWEAVMGENPSQFRGEARRPVEKVSWGDCQKFLSKLNSQFPIPGCKFRLPTEAEWEYACRAGTTTRFYWGDDPRDKEIGDYAWEYRESGREPHPVGQKKPNAWGLYDLSGNVWEWCHDWHGNYGPGRAADPTGPSSGSGRVLRGGSWSGFARHCRAASRDSAAPRDSRRYVGFRVLCEVRGTP